MKRTFFIFLLTLLWFQVYSQKIPKSGIQDLKKEWTSGKKDIYIINFWATWCAPCVKELPDFEKITKRFDSLNVEVILVSLDFKEDYKKKLPAFLKKRNMISRVVWLNETNPNYYVPIVSKEWNGAIPATLIFSENSDSQFFERQMKYEELEKIINDILEKKSK